MQRDHQARAFSESRRRKLRSPNLRAMRDARGPSAGNRLHTRWRSFRASTRPAFVPIRSDTSARRTKISVTVCGRKRPADSFGNAISSTPSRKSRVVCRRRSTGVVASSKGVIRLEGALVCFNVPGEVQWCSSQALRMPNLAMRPNAGSVPPSSD
jgi:hypothetical protein